MPNSQSDALPSMLLRKYIAYARKYCHPRYAAYTPSTEALLC